jgi:hypothetical protein
LDTEIPDRLHWAGLASLVALAIGMNLTRRAAYRLHLERQTQEFAMRQLLASLILFACAQASSAVENSKYFVFIGEKISVEAVVPKEGEIPFDSEYIAKYRILESYRGSYDGTQIEFTAYDHYGFPGFANYQHVLLFVELDDGKYYHAKYQYSALYKTKDGRWAGPYDAYDYGHEFNRETTIKPVIIDFLEPVQVDVSGHEKRSIEKWFPAPYFRIAGGKAIAVYGNYVPELFLLKQNGVLKARGDFQ